MKRSALLRCYTSNSLNFTYSTMEGLKEQISALASAVKDYSALTSALEDKTLSSGGLSPEVLGKVKGMVRSAVIEHWVMDAQEKVKADVIAELKSSVLASTRDTQQNVIVRKVSDAVTAAVNSNAPSQVSLSISLF